jgi:hypothetical protein
MHNWVVGNSYGGEMYPFDSGICTLARTCSYSSSTDMLIAKQNIQNRYTGTVVIYNNFKSRLVKITNNFGKTVSYGFNSSSPDYIFQTSDSFNWPVAGMAVSENGEWIAVEMQQRGIGIINTISHSFKRISAIYLVYSLGTDPDTQMAINNSGTAVALMGVNAGITVIGINDSCGDRLIEAPGYLIEENHKFCKQLPISREKFITRFYDAYYPRFSYDGAELRFLTRSYLDDTRAVIVRASGYFTPRMDYIALGDSFSSGEGETSDIHYIQGTNDPLEKCHVSDRSYPFLVAKYFHIEDQYFKSLACSGAKTTDVIGDVLNYWGQNDRLGLNGLKLDNSLKEVSQLSAIDNFIQGRVHQEDFVGTYHPDIVTIGIGANDAGFMSKLRSCIGPGTCGYATDPRLRLQTADELKGVFNRLVNTYMALHQESPSTKIYAVGYSKITGTGLICGGSMDVLLDQTERLFMNEAILYLNQIVRVAASKAGVGYIDIENALGSQKLCDESRPTVMNAIRVGDDNNLTELLPNFKVIGQESFHPLPNGHQKILESIIGSGLDLINDQYCPNNIQGCATDIAAPEPSSYWTAGTKDNNYRTQVSVVLTDGVINLSKHSIYSLKLDPYSLAEGSKLSVELHSTPIIIGKGAASDVGAITLNITIPADATDGYHMLHAYGLSYDGEPVDYYQDIQVVHDNPDVAVSLTHTVVQPSAEILNTIPDVFSPAYAVKTRNLNAIATVAHGADNSLSITVNTNASAPLVGSNTSLIPKINDLSTQILPQPAYSFIRYVLVACAIFILSIILISAARRSMRR